MFNYLGIIYLILIGLYLSDLLLATDRATRWKFPLPSSGMVALGQIEAADEGAKNVAAGTSATRHLRKRMLHLLCLLYMMVEYFFLCRRQHVNGLCSTTGYRTLQASHFVCLTCRGLINPWNPQYCDALNFT